MSEPILRPSRQTSFTLNIEDRIYRCPVSDAALYMLCRNQDSSLDQVDAYLQLKWKVQLVVENLLAEGEHCIPEVLEPDHFLAN
jgi:hypothetical protein